MATYVMSDVHGQYDKFEKLLKKIKLKDSDTLYVLGDIVDRGPDPIKVLLKLMEMPNAICLVGNHELMAIEGLEFLSAEITDEAIEKANDEFCDNFANWIYNGASTTMQEFIKLDYEMKLDVIDYLKDFLIYEELTVAGKNYLLVHAGLGNYSPGKEIDEYSIRDLVWCRADYDTQYFEDTYVISGHTPTQFIERNPRPGYIYRKKNHIAIDCGAHIPGGRLAAFCLDTQKAFYVE